MILRGARVALGPTEAARLDIGIESDRVRVCSSAVSGPELDVDGFLILPGLINAHDHLEFNLFPRLGAGPYSNATAWAKDIYRPEEPPVREHLKLAKPVRLVWGGIKNLVSGVTSVLHHNPYDPVFDAGFPVRVLRRFSWSHSLAFSRDVVGDRARTPPEAPFLIHACEGTDACAADEVYRLDAAGVLGRATVLVHGVALDKPGLDLVKKRGSSLVWCPSSNYFTLGRTLSKEALDSGIPIAIGTDSALTASGDLIDEIEVAQRHVAAECLYGMLTDVAARVLRLQDGEGTISDGGVADLLLVRDRGVEPAIALLDMHPEAVFLGGRIKLISPQLARRVPSSLKQNLQLLQIEGRGEWLIGCDVSMLFDACSRVIGSNFRLAGKAVAA
jgi:cytosine/adenosine deaminase-related metal-dependent hydrolase